MKKKLNFILTLSILLGFSYGLTNYEEVKADERIIILNPSYGLGYSVNLAKDECIDIDKLIKNKDKIKLPFIKTQIFEGKKNIN